MNNNYNSLSTRLATCVKTFVRVIGDKLSITQSKGSGYSLMTVLLVVLSMTISQRTWSQSIANYAFGTNTNGTLQDLSSGSTSYLSGNLDDTAGTVQALGFNFTFMGTTYSYFSANSNGQMSLHTSAGATAIGSNVSTASGTAILAPFTGDNEVGNGLRYKVIGSAPNRTFVLEWNQFYVNFVNISNAGNMQVWLDETTGKITYIYGEIYNSSTSSQTRSISIASSNTATTVGSITIGASPTFAVSATLVTNTIAAGANPVGSPLIADIGSSANGSRRFFTFTPNYTTPLNPTTLSFTAVTATTITPSWVDNSTDESFFKVTRATDAGFTQNVVLSTVDSTTPAGTGTAYTLAQTGLSPGTTYFYKIQSSNEAGIPGTGITGSQTTTAGITYYWVGTSGGTWSTAANWDTNPAGGGSLRTTALTTDVLIVDGAGTTAGAAVTISVDVASFSIGQLQVTSNTACTLQSSIATTRTITITGGGGDDFVIQAGSTLNLTNVNAVAFAFSGTANTGDISGTLNFAGSTSNVLTTTGGTGTLVTVASSGIVNLGTTVNSLVGSVASLSFAAGSNCNSTGATTGAPPVPLATWAPTSNLTITGITTSTTGPTNKVQTFGNLTYNCPLATAIMSFFTTSTVVINGNLTITAGAVAGTGIFRALTSGSLTVNGNVIVTQGRLQSASSTGTFIAAGNTTIGANGIIDILAGTYSQRGTTFTNNGILTGVVSTSTLQFYSPTNVAQTLAGSGTVLTNVGAISVQNTGGLTITHVNTIPTLRVNLFNGMITGSNAITLGTGAALNTTVQIGYAGNILAGGSFDVAPAFNLGTGTHGVIYSEELASRTTGFEIPSSRDLRSITSTNVNGIVVAGGNLATGTLTFGTGTGNITTNSSNVLTVTGTTVGSVVRTSLTAYVNGPLVLTLPASLAATTYTFPIGKGTLNTFALVNATTNAGGTVTVQAEAFDGDAGGSAGLNISAVSSTKYWAASITGGAGNFTDALIQLNDTTTGRDAIGGSSTVNGAYDIQGGVSVTTTGTTMTTTAPANTTLPGFFLMANKAAASLANLAISPIGNQCTNVARTITVDVTPGGAAVTGVNLNYAINGVAQTAVTMTNTTGNGGLATDSWSGVIPTVVPANASVTWSVTATDANSLAKTQSGTSYKDEPLFGATASASASINTFCGSGSSVLTANLILPGGGVIGTGTSLTADTTQPTAFNNRWPSYRMQLLFTASELQAAGIAAGNITSMAFNIATLGSANTNSGFTVNIGNTALTSFTAFVPTTGFTTVFPSATYTHTATGLQTIPFSTPFAWDGTSNIIVDVLMNGADSSNNSQTYYTTTAANTMINTETVSTGTPTISANRLNVTFTGASPISLVSWNDGTNTFTGNPLTTGTLTTTTTYTQTITAYGCTTSAAPVTVTVNPVPTAPIGTDSNQCGNQAPTASVANPVGNGFSGAIFKWYADNVTTTALQSDISTTYLTAINATQTFYVSVVNPTTLCESTRTPVTVTVQSPQAITVTPGVTASVCQNGTIILGASSSPNTYTYSWTASPEAGSGILNSSPLLGDSVSVTPTGSGTYVYTVSGTDGNCTGINTVTVTVNAAPIIIIATPAPICPGGSATLTALTGAIGPGTATIGTDTTLTSASTQPTAFCNRWPSYRMQTVYTAAELQAAGLTAGNITSMAFNITTLGDAATNDAFEVKIGTTGSSTLSGSFVSTASGFTTVYPSQTYTHTATGLQTIPFSTPYNWDGLSNIIVEVIHDGADNFNNSTTYYTATTGNTVAYTTTNATNSASFSNQRLNVVFAGITQTSSIGTLTYNWTSPATSGNVLTVSPIATTTYEASGYDSSTTCTGYKSVTVTVNTPPAAPTGTNSSQCAPGVPTASVSSPLTTPTFNWYVDNVATTPLQSSLSTTYTTSISTTTTFYVSVTNATAGCESTRTPVTVTVNTPGTISVAGTATICSGQSTTLTASPVTGTINSYAWLPVTGLTPATGASVLASPSNTTTYTVTGQDSNGCFTPGVSVTVTVSLTPSAVSVTSNASPICDGDIVTLTATGGTVASSGSATLGTETTTEFGGSVYRNGAGSGDFRHQILYTKAELNAAGINAGNLTSIAFNVTSVGTGAANNYQIKLASTAATALTSTFDTATFTTVYNAATYTAVSGVNLHTFTTPFAWDGNSNIIVDICYNYPDFTGGSSTVSATTPASLSNTNLLASVGACTATTGSTYANRPLATFGFSIPVSVTTSWTTSPASTLYTNSLATAGNEYVPGASASILYAKPNVQTTYTATATAGSCSSAPASVTVDVNPLPVFTLANSITVCQGTGATITIPETNINYSWSPLGSGLTVISNGVALANPSATTTYTVTGVSTTNFCQSTSDITVNVNDPGTIVTQPTNKATAVGYGTSFTVVGTTGISYGYHWQIKTGPTTYANLNNDANYAGVDTSVLTISNAGSGTAVDNTTYRCLLTPPAPCADLITNTVLLTVSNTGIATSPTSVNICLPTPSTAQFSVVTNGDDPYLVEWQVSTDGGANYNTIPLIDIDTFLYIGPNTTAVPGLTFEHPIDAFNPNGTGSEFKVLNVSGIVDPTTLKFQAIVNEVLTSGVATLTVSNPPSFVSNVSTTPVIVCAAPSASPTTLSITTAGTVGTVVWKYATSAGGTYNDLATSPPAGVTYATATSGSTYSLTVTTTTITTPVGNYYYKAFVTGTGSCSNIESNVAVISVVRPTVAIVASSASYCLPGAAVTLTASGSDIGNYSWTSSPTGYTSTSTVASVTPSVATTYTVLGTDSNGCTNSATVSVGVGTSFTVAASAAPATVCPGAPVALSAVSTASGGTTYLVNTTPYQFNAVSGAFTALVGGTTSGLSATADDTMSGNITPGSGFSFTYGGTAYTTFRASSNGQLIFGTVGTQSASNNLATTTTGQKNGLAPLWDDLQLTAGLTYQLSGTAPNRVLTVEWLNMEWNYASNTPVISFQVKLYETTNVVEYVYRQEATAVNSGSASIGLIGTASGNFISLQDASASPVLSTSTSANSINTKPATGQIYRFTPVIPVTYTYAWTSTPSGFSATGTPATANPGVNTAYNVIATSNQGCTATSTASVTVDSLPAVVTALPATQNICAGTTATFTVSATSATPLTYVWKKDGSPLSNGSGVSGATTATLTITGTTAANNGSYTVDVINCSTVTSTATVLTVNPLPTATLTGTTSLCQNDASPSVTFTGAAGTAPYTFTYKLNGGTNQTVTTTSGNSVTVSAPTAVAGSFVYSLVSVQDSSSSACSQAQTGSAAVTVNPLPIAAVLSTNSPVCEGNALNLSTPDVIGSITILTQDFESGLGTWTVASGSTGGANTTLANFNIRAHGWLGGSGATTAFNSPGGTSFLLADADGAGSGIAMNTQLTSPSFSTVGYSAVSLSFRQYHRYLTNPAIVQVSTDGGTVWTNVASYASTEGTATGFVTATVSLNAYIGLPNVKLRYSFSGGWIYYWAIDDISISGIGVQTFSYAWSGPNSFSSTAQNPTIANATVAASGSYSLEITNSNGCKATSNVSAIVGAQPSWYLDADGDHYYTGAAVVQCASPGVGYTTSGLLGGGDCADDNAAINPGHVEVCWNGIDDNCNTTLSEGCAPVVVNMTPSYHNTTLSSLAIAVPAVPYYYAPYTNLKYRFSITNVTTGVTAPDIIQTSRFVNIPQALHAYNATYTIKASAVINDEVVPYAGNTITVFSPVVQLITLNSVSCGATLASLSSTLSANEGLNATGYTFRIRLTSDNGPTPTYGTSSSATRFVSANSFAGFPLSYGTSYKVAVQYTFTDPVTSLPVDSGYGAECTVITPSIPLIGLSSPTCGGQVATLGANISATPGSYATSYQFRIRLTSDNGPTPTYYTTLPNASRFSSLSAFQGITFAYNTNYSISVQYSIVNNSTTVWSGYGSECIVKTPFFPTTQLVQSQCGLLTATSLTQQLNIIAYPGFPNYKVRLTEVIGEDLGTPQDIVVTYPYFKLNQFSSVQLGKNYTVSVAIKQGGVFGDFSTECDLHTAAPAKSNTVVPFKATAYPNPFANNFMIDVKTMSQSTVNLKVYDMVGRLLEQRDVRVSDLETTTIGDRYPSGVYNVVVSQEDSVETVRVVKR